MSTAKQPAGGGAPTRLAGENAFGIHFTKRAGQGYQ